MRRLFVFAWCVEWFFMAVVSGTRINRQLGRDSFSSVLAITLYFNKNLSHVSTSVEQIWILFYVGQTVFR